MAPVSSEAKNSSLRVLVIAEAANPSMASVPLVGWSHAQALARIADVHLVTQVRNKKAIEETGWIDGQEFTSIDSERIARPCWKIAEKLRGGPGKGWTLVTAMQVLPYLYFERLVWKKFRDRIKQGAYDVVHRITPLSPALPSTLARRCQKAGVPFVIGPLNGGVPWPKGFGGTRRREKEWLSYLRGSLKWMPGYHKTRRSASGIIIGSRITLNQLPQKYRSKAVYIPENAIDPNLFPPRPIHRIERPLRIASLGRLVPLKGTDMLLEACTELMQKGALTLDIIGDGPERAHLEKMAQANGVADSVTFAGWIEHEQVNQRLCQADLLGFPSIREFGGGVALEAMALGVVPLVIDYGGPSELVTEDTGFRIPMDNRTAIVHNMRSTLESVIANPQCLTAMGQAAAHRVQQVFTWDKKAQQVCEVYRWVLGHRNDKPDFGIPLRSKPSDAGL